MIASITGPRWAKAWAEHKALGRQWEQEVSLTFGCDQPGFIRLYDGLHPVAEVELGEDMADVDLDRALGQEKLGSDLAVGPAPREQPEHVAFPVGEGLEQAVTPGGPFGVGEQRDKPVDEPPG